MAIIAFAGKLVGLRCIEFLLSRGYPLSRVVIAHESDTELASALGKAGVRCDVFTSKEGVLSALAGEKFAWLLNLWSPHILTPPLLGLAAHRLNIHPSLAPHCLGSDSATWAIRKGVPAGVSLLEMGEAIDAGAVYAQREVPWTFPEPAHALFDRLKSAGVELFQEHWDSIFRGRIVPAPQEGAGSYHTLRMTRADRTMAENTQMSVGHLLRWALAHDFSPRSSAEVVVNDVTYNLTINLTPKHPAA